MKNLQNIKFKGKDWTDLNKEVEGKLHLRDYKTIEPANPDSNPNGYIMCIETEDGFHTIVHPDTVEMISNDPLALKWKKLDDAIAPYYDEDDDRFNDEEGLLAIGEIAASHLGYL